MALPYWRLSGFYFFYFATLGIFLPYWSLYLAACGFNAIEIGELTAMMMATKIVAPNIWGWLADRRGERMQVIRLTSLLTILFFTGFFFQADYYWFALCSLSFSFFWNAALPQVEAATLFHLDGQTHRYSQIRLWGSIGFIVAVIGIGRFLDFFSIMHLPVVLLALMVSIWLTVLSTPDAQIQPREHVPATLGQILRRPEVLAFMIVYMLLQVAHGPYYVFYSVYLAEHDYSSTLIGLLWTLGVCAEIVLFVFIKRVLKSVSLRTILLFSIALSIVRWLLVAHGVEQIGLMLLAQLFHAATFGSSHVVAIHLVHQYFGDRHQGKGQALYSSVSFGLGGMIGSLCSGYLWDSLGATFVYSLAAVSCCAAMLIALLWIGKDDAVANREQPR